MEENIKANYIYHGDADYGVLVSKRQLFKHCIRRDCKWMDNLHIGPMLLNPHARYIGKEIDQGGPWGYRHQFNIADSGYGLRGPRVLNDRAGEIGQTLSVEDFDLVLIFCCLL